MLTPGFKILAAVFITLVTWAALAAVVCNQYLQEQEIKQLKFQLGYVVVTPTSVPTPTAIVTATPSATVAPAKVTKLPITIVPVTPTTKAVVK